MPMPGRVQFSSRFWNIRITLRKNKGGYGFQSKPVGDILRQLKTAPVLPATEEILMMGPAFLSSIINKDIHGNSEIVCIHLSFYCPEGQSPYDISLHEPGGG